MNVPKISIVTITYNVEELIESTVKSVLDQDYPNLEYVIIDGKSKDQTLEVVRKYEDKIDRIISEPDKNLYDAMNKGIKYATGDYICFIHAGDHLMEKDTLSRAMQEHKDEDFLYGDAIMEAADGTMHPWRKTKPPANKLSWKNFKYGMVICHQAMIVKKKIVPEYDLKWKVSSDIDWTINVLKRACSVRDTGMVLCRFLDGGLSSKQRRQSWKERFWISIKHFGWLETLAEHLMMIPRAIKRGSIS